MQDYLSEKAIIGSILMDNSTIEIALRYITEFSFRDQKNQYLFKIFTELHNIDQKFDVLVISQEIIKRKLNHLIHPAYLSKLMLEIASSANIEYHCQIIANRTKKTELAKCLQSELVQCTSDSADVFDSISRLEKSISEITSSFAKSNLPSLALSCDNTLNYVKERMESDELISGVKTGFTSLDLMLFGYEAGLHIIAARPAQGKTALMLNIANNIAENGRNIGIFSLEMPTQQLILRMLCSQTGIKQNRIKFGNTNIEEYELLKKAKNKIVAQNRFAIDDTDCIELDELLYKAREMKRKNNVSMIMIDYIQRVKNRHAKDKRLEIDSISEALKKMSKDLNIPVVALAQLNRNVESRTNNRPILSDLKEAGGIEQDADSVTFIMRPETFGIKEIPSPNTIFAGINSQNKALLIVAKNRHGEIGDVLLNFDGTIMKFTDFEEENIHIKEEKPNF